MILIYQKLLMGSKSYFISVGGSVPVDTHRHPETLARDASFLTRKGYKVRKIQGVDMFPHTGHVETVALFCKK